MWWIIGIFVYILGARVFYLRDPSRDINDDDENVVVAVFWPIITAVYLIIEAIDAPAKWIVKKFFK